MGRADTILQTHSNPLDITSLALTRDIDEDLTLVWANFLEAFAPSSTSGQQRQQTAAGRIKIKEEKKDFIPLDCVTHNVMKSWRQKQLCVFSTREVGVAVAVDSSNWKVSGEMPPNFPFLLLSSQFSLDVWPLASFECCYCYFRTNRWKKNVFEQTVDFSSEVFYAVKSRQQSTVAALCDCES